MIVSCYFKYLSHSLFICALVGFLAQYSYFQQVLPFIRYEKDKFLSTGLKECRKGPVFLFINDRGREWKIAFCPVCLEILTTKLYFASDGYLYHKKCFSKLNFKSPISRQNFLYYFPVNKLITDKVYFEKDNKNNSRIIYDFNGLNQNGFKRKEYDRNRFNIKRNDEN